MERDISVQRAHLGDEQEVARFEHAFDDEDNEGAMGLYSRTGGRWDGTQQVMFEYDLDDS